MKAVANEDVVSPPMSARNPRLTTIAAGVEVGGPISNGANRLIRAGRNDRNRRNPPTRRCRIRRGGHSTEMNRRTSSRGMIRRPLLLRCAGIPPPPGTVDARGRNQASHETNNRPTTIPSAPREVAAHLCDGSSAPAALNRGGIVRVPAAELPRKIHDAPPPPLHLPIAPMVNTPVDAARV